MRVAWSAALLAAAWVAVPALAGPADVVSASATCEASTCRFRVTLRHDDTGWDHYADAWEVVAPDGTLLGTRVLRHPHVAEQPFTRELSGVRVPPGLTHVRIRARDSVHGHGGREQTLALDRRHRAPGAPSSAR